MPCALNRAQRRPHARAVALKHTRRASHPRACAFHRACSGPHHKAVHPQPLTQWFSLAGRVPSSTHRGIPICGPRTINRPRMGPQGCTCTLNCTPRIPHPWALRPQPRMKLSSPQGCAPSTPMKGVPTRRPWPSTTHGGVPTHGQHALNWARRGPDPPYPIPEKCIDGSLLVGLAS